MGNHSILDARKHLVNLLASIDRIQDSEHAYNLAQAINDLIHCEHTEIALDTFQAKGVKTDDDDFPDVFE